MEPELYALLEWLAQQSMLEVEQRRKPEEVGREILGYRDANTSRGVAYRALWASLVRAAAFYSRADSKTIVGTQADPLRPGRCRGDLGQHVSRVQAVGRQAASKGHVEAGARPGLPPVLERGKACFYSLKTNACPDWSRWLPREGFPLVLGAGKPAQSRTLATSLEIVRACVGRFTQIERVRHIDAQPAVYGDRTQSNCRRQ